MLTESDAMPPVRDRGGVIIPRAVVYGAVVTVILGYLSWITLGHIAYGDRIAKLETSDATNLRQDTELREIRATIQTLTVLFLDSDRRAHGPPTPVEMPIVLGRLEVVEEVVPEDEWQQAQRSLDELAVGKGLKKKRKK